MFAAQQTVRQFVTHCRSKQIVAVLLLIHACLLSWNAIRLAPVATEMAHLVAGLSHLELNRYDLMAVNPPLVRTVAVLPLPLFFSPKYDWSSYDPEPLSRSEHFVGRDFVLINGSQAFVFLSVARLLCIPFSLLGLLICYAWAAELYGRVSGILSASLWCFSPIILGHGSLILPDVSAAALGVTATYIFRWTLFAPSIGKTIASGFVLGLAVLAKMTLLVLYPVFAVFWILWPRSVPGRFWFRLRHACLQVLVSVLVINMGYAFTDTLLPLRTFQFHSITLSGITSWKEARNLGENRFKNTWLGSLPCPLPASFVKGLDKQKSDFESPQPSFLFGEWKQGGWPWYYCAGLLLKLPAGTWVLLGIAIYLSIARRKYNASFADEMLVLLPMLSILLLVSSQTAFNHHLRYVIPCLPFLYVWIGKVARLTSFWGILIVAALAVWNVVSSLAFYPHSYSYFNELCGGPRAGPQYFSESNVAWGQDMFQLQEWLDKHQEVENVFFKDCIFYDPGVLGINWYEMPVGADGIDSRNFPVQKLGPQPGWYVINVCYLHDNTKNYTYLLDFAPFASIGYSYNIYKITQEQATNYRCGTTIKLPSGSLQIISGIDCHVRDSTIRKCFVTSRRRRFLPGPTSVRFHSWRF